MGVEREAKDREALRARIAGLAGPRYWRCLEELSRAPEIEELLEREFPAAAAAFPGEVGRREFLRLMGASLALAGLAGCTRQPEERIVPYVDPPEAAVPGKPL